MLEKMGWTLCGRCALAGVVRLAFARCFGGWMDRCGCGRTGGCTGTGTSTRMCRAGVQHDTLPWNRTLWCFVTWRLIESGIGFHYVITTRCAVQFWWLIVICDDCGGRPRFPPSLCEASAAEKFSRVEAEPKTLKRDIYIKDACHCRPGAAESRGKIALPFPISLQHLHVVRGNIA